MNFPSGDISEVELARFRYLRFNHGTHVMGTIGAVHNNERGLAGVVDISRGNLYGVDVFENVRRDGNDNLISRTDSTLLAEALRDLVVNQGARIINFSIGGDTRGSASLSDRLEREMQRLIAEGHDFLIIHAAGNSIKNARYNSLFANIPGNVVCINGIPLRDRIITVGATDSQGRMTDFTNYGPRVDVVAPGVDIYSTLRTTPSGTSSRYYYDIYCIREYGYPCDHRNCFIMKYAPLSGTSHAAPHVAGIAALVWGADPSLTAAEVKQIIVSTARTYGNDVVDHRPNITPTFRGRTYHQVDALSAVEVALDIRDLPPIEAYYDVIILMDDSFLGAVRWVSFVMDFQNPFRYFSS